MQAKYKTKVDAFIDFRVTKAGTVVEYAGAADDNFTPLNAEAVKSQRAYFNARLAKAKANAEHRNSTQADVDAVHVWQSKLDALGAIEKALAPVVQGKSNPLE